jgi:hypothetical protein
VTRVLALVAAPSLESTAGTEFLRVLVALRAAGADVRLVEAGRGAGALSAADLALELEGERYLAALAEDGVTVGRGDDVPADIGSADAVVVFPDPARSGVPPVHVLSRGANPLAIDVATLLQAGQIVMGSALPAD